MHFFTSIGFAALCLMVSIQAAPTPYLVPDRQGSNGENAQKLVPLTDVLNSPGSFMYGGVRPNPSS